MCPGKQHETGYSQHTWSNCAKDAKSRFFMAPSICSMRFGTICCCIPKKEKNKYQKPNTILRAVLGRLCFGATVYHIWKQRNDLLHNNTPRTEEAILIRVRWEAQAKIVAKGKISHFRKFMNLVAKWNLHSLEWWDVVSPMCLWGLMGVWFLCFDLVDGCLFFGCSL
jgi:hypothetical protein